MPETRPPEPAPGPAPEPAPEPAHDPAARLLCDVRAPARTPDASGVLWKLAESGRQLDANLVRLPAGEHIGSHAEPDLDVLVLVVGGEGALHTPQGELPLAEGALVWLPHGSTRSITAGPEGLGYVTVHRRRPGMRIRPHPDSALASARPAPGRQP
ncbi:cupin domain-containing protein [Streptomyces sp. NPDC013181]|uniref:cupin domain-containing protein n=1 Tax=Streptomyces sp. NPDC013181 TaxID=3364864 RepID=UPI00369B5E5E